MSKEIKAGLIFPLDQTKNHLHELLLTNNVNCKFSPGCIIYLVASMEYIIAEIVELSKFQSKTEIITKFDIEQVIVDDPELNKLYNTSRTFFDASTYTNKYNYGQYINKLGITQKIIDQNGMNFLNELFELILKMVAFNFSLILDRKIGTSRHLQNIIYLVFPGQLGIHAVSGSTKAVSKFWSQEN